MRSITIAPGDSSVRLLWIGHNLAYPPVRGVLQRSFNLLRQVSGTNEVHVLAFDQPPTRPSGVSVEDCVDALRKFCAAVDWVPLSDGIRGARYWIALRGLLSPNPYDLNWLASTAMAERIRRTVERVKFDAVHFDTLGLAQYRGLVNEVGTVLNHHNIESSMMERRAAAETRRVRRKYWLWEARKLLRAERAYCRRFTLNLVVSPQDGQALSERVPGVQAQVVENGVDTEYFRPRPDPGGSTLLFCGGLDWYPNGDAMAYFFDRIWPRLSRQRPDTRVVVVGRQPPNWLTQLGKFDTRVQVTGFVDDVRPYFGSATVYVCPIRIGGGTRLKILDALAMGLPLVGTTFACSGISVQHGKHVLMADTPDAFVDQILRLFGDPALRAQLAAQGRDLVCRDYAWPVIGKRLLDAYKRAASLAGDERGLQASLR